jgi:hypothetical protein
MIDAVCRSLGCAHIRLRSQRSWVRVPHCAQGFSGSKSGFPEEVANRLPIAAANLRPCWQPGAPRQLVLFARCRVRELPALFEGLA